MIEGDSDEYWFLTEAVEMSKDVEGACCEIGIRRGFSTKTMLDAIREHSPTKQLISIDPYGNLPYIGRETEGIAHYDYTDEMKNDAMSDLWTYIRLNKMNWRPECLRSEDFFDLYKSGVPFYNYNGACWINKYSMVFLDGIHTVDAVTSEWAWFDHRMDKGAIICIDDITPDFMDIEAIEISFPNWRCIKKGNKKGLWIKE